MIVICMYMSIFLNPFYREWSADRTFPYGFFRAEFDVRSVQIRTDPYGISFLIYVDSSWIYLR